MQSHCFQTVFCGWLKCQNISKEEEHKNSFSFLFGEPQLRCYLVKFGSLFPVSIELFWYFPNKQFAQYFFVKKINLGSIRQDMNSRPLVYGSLLLPSHHTTATIILDSLFLPSSYSTRLWQRNYGNIGWVS